MVQPDPACWNAISYSIKEMIAFPLLLPILETNNKESGTKFLFIRIAIVLDGAIAGFKFDRKITWYENGNWKVKHLINTFFPLFKTKRVDSTINRKIPP